MTDIPALILAGGLGTRLRGVLADRPKVLAPVAGRPFVSYLLEQLDAAGVSRVMLCTGYRGDEVERTFGARYGSLALTYSREEAPRGTAGALRLALPQVAGSLLLALNGDSYVACPLAEFIAWHRERRGAGSLLLTSVADVARFGSVEVDANGVVQSFREKRAAAGHGWINAGVYLLERRLLESIPPDRPVSLEQEMLPQWLTEGLGGYARELPFLDIGTPESLAAAEAFLQRVRPELRREAGGLSKKGQS
jgi:NDP-sugar pyrophosphorylase family protein